ncbi:hypothetical protein BDF20DRAFT_240685 [Mycotypha africana]|uniref:uncharacterized protein n=1 Tax=Mycotypha africana TaxID=64632 RepID=UPI002300E5E9|nr:uncharacterized protein BDF20DRAFT_240685 [Mycotypha africana]KAI8967288.1 hypothetical protein BDF20DRAFT_240685 [Mycotypha africana]
MKHMYTIVDSGDNEEYEEYEEEQQLVSVETFETIAKPKMTVNFEEQNQSKFEENVGTDDKEDDNRGFPASSSSSFITARDIGLYGSRPASLVEREGTVTINPQITQSTGKRQRAASSDPTATVSAKVEEVPVAPQYIDKTRKSRNLEKAAAENAGNTLHETGSLHRPVITASDTDSTSIPNGTATVNQEKAPLKAKKIIDTLRQTPSKETVETSKPFSTLDFGVSSLKPTEHLSDTLQDNNSQELQTQITDSESFTFVAAPSCITVTPPLHIIPSPKQKTLYQQAGRWLDTLHSLGAPAPCDTNGIKTSSTAATTAVQNDANTLLAGAKQQPLITVVDSFNSSDHVIIPTATTSTATVTSSTTATTASSATAIITHNVLNRSAVADSLKVKNIIKMETIEVETEDNSRNDTSKTKSKRRTKSEKQQFKKPPTQANLSKHHHQHHHHHSTSDRKVDIQVIEVVENFGVKRKPVPQIIEPAARQQQVETVELLLDED